MPLGLHPAEFVPAAPLLPVLAEVMGYAVAFGICVLALQIVRAFFGGVGSAIGWIPWLGSKGQGPLHAIEQKVTNELGAAVAGLDRRMALAWYKLAHLAERIGKEIMANAATLGAIAAVIAGLPGFSDWRAFIAKVKASLVWAEQHALGAVHTITRPLTANVSALSRWTHAQIRVLAHAIDVTIIPGMSRLRARNTFLGRQYIDLFRLIHKINARFAAAAFAGLVAVALGSLGLGWVRCRAVGRVGGHICRLGPQLIEDLLAVGLEVVIVSDICQIANAIESAAILMEPELDKLVGLSDYLCRAGGASYPSAMVDSDRQGRGGNPTALIPADLAA